MKKLFAVMLLAFSLINIGYSAEADEQEKSLKLFSKMGETAFNKHGRDLFDVAQNGRLSVILSSLIQQIPESTRTEESLDALEKYHQDHFSSGARAASSLYNSLQQSHDLPHHSRPTLTSEEIIFSHLGLGLAYCSTHEGDRRIFRKSLEELYTRGENQFKVMSWSQNGLEDISEPQAVTTTQDLGEQRAFIIKASALSYIGLKTTPLTHSLRFWDVAQPAGQWAYLYFGPQSYKYYEADLFTNPMESRFTQMIAEAPALKETIPYPEATLSNIRYEDFPDSTDKFQHFFMDELKSFLNARLMGHFLLKKFKERTVDDGIKVAQTTKKWVYKTLCDLIVRLYPEKSIDEKMAMGKSLVNSDWCLEQMATLFMKDENNRDTNTPNWDNGLWSELILGSDKVCSLRDQPHLDLSALSLD